MLKNLSIAHRTMAACRSDRLSQQNAASLSNFIHMECIGLKAPKEKSLGTVRMIFLQMCWFLTPIPRKKITCRYSINPDDGSPSGAVRLRRLVDASQNEIETRCSKARAATRHGRRHRYGRALCVNAWWGERELRSRRNAYRAVWRPSGRWSSENFGRGRWFNSAELISFVRPRLRRADCCRFLQSANVLLQSYSR